MAGLYIHIPFCRKACHYCNFHFSTTHQQLPAMLAAMEKELQLQKDYLQEPLATIYLGGGTPSLVPIELLESLFLQIRSQFQIVDGAEITIETNPDDINPTALLAWKALGINRLSIGIQSFVDADLQWMNRAHHAQQAIDSIRLAKQAGFDNLTIDLIYGTPTLSDEAWKQNVDLAIAAGISHLSCYALTVEPKTGLEKMIEKKQIEAVDPEKQARHFSLLMQWMEEAGFEHYEISNFALPGHRSKHNSSYWSGASYLGIGPSAHSFNGTSRQWNLANNSLYIQSMNKGSLPFELETLTAEQQLNEYIMTSLRTMEGLNLNRVSALWGQEKTAQILLESKKYIARGDAYLEDHALILTKAGRLLADGIASDLFFLSAED
ncbi:MAG: coproporphyrinogen III oxidase [Chitinophagaceae bacterium BSSC1]|nr:MAG: coproporphyrinogen III oxidase [Chitinophagaceae bacterium BSSC1]